MPLQTTRLSVFICLTLGFSALASAQTFSSRGFGDARLFLYPQAAPNDPTHAVGDALLRFEPSIRASSWLRIAASLDARIDTHDQVERRWTIDWRDRSIQRPPFSVRRLSALLSKGGGSLEVGKQFIRWGKADVLNPTDRFAPRDFLTVVDNEFLGVTAARFLYEAGGNTIDVAWALFTPSRIPLFDQRWSVVPAAIAVGALPPGGVPPGASLPPTTLIPVTDAGASYPNKSQEGIRFNRSGPGYEFSVSFYDGFNHLPLFDAALRTGPLSVALTRVFPQMRMYGGDAAIPNRWFTLKGEFAYFTSTTSSADEYGIYVLQVERQVRDWDLVGGYAGDFLTRHGAVVSPVTGAPSVAASVTIAAFSADRGLTRAFLGRAALTLDADRDLAFEGAVRQNGHGSWVKGQYSHAYGNHLRATIEGNWIRGREDDFLGQFHRNSNVNLAVRYSF